MTFDHEEERVLLEEVSATIGCLAKIQSITCGVRKLHV